VSATSLVEAGRSRVDALKSRARSSGRGPARISVGLVVGVTAIVAYSIPARQVLPGLGGAGVPALVLGLGMLVWWAVSRLVPGSFVDGGHPLRATIQVFVVAFFVSYTLGFLRAMPVSEVSGSDRSLLRYAALVGIALVIIDGVRSRRELDLLLTLLVVAGVVMGVVGSLQFLFSIDVTASLRLPFLQLNAERLLGVTTRGEDVPRVAGTANHFIEFGVLMALLVPLALYGARVARTTARRVLFTTATLFLATASLFSVSRSAVVALAVVVLVALPAGTWATRVNLLGLLATAAVVVVVGLPGLVATFGRLFGQIEEDSGVQARTGDYEVVLPLVADRPWFGRGPGTYSPLTYTLLDNQWLVSVVSIGIVGTAALMAVFVVAFFQAKRVGRWGEDPRDRQLGHMLGASIAAAFVVSFFFDSLAFSTFAVTTVILIGSAGALWRLAGRPGPPVAGENPESDGVRTAGGRDA